MNYYICTTNPNCTDRKNVKQSQVATNAKFAASPGNSNERARARKRLLGRRNILCQITIVHIITVALSQGVVKVPLAENVIMKATTQHVHGTK
jgi:hypothetical protein